jgi:hypothetical protein
VIDDTEKGFEINRTIAEARRALETDGSVSSGVRALVKGNAIGDAKMRCDKSSRSLYHRRLPSIEPKGSRKVSRCARFT